MQFKVVVGEDVCNKLLASSSVKNGSSGKINGSLILWSVVRAFIVKIGGFGCGLEIRVCRHRPDTAIVSLNCTNRADAVFGAAVKETGIDLFGGSFSKAGLLAERW